MKDTTFTAWWLVGALAMLAGGTFLDWPTTPPPMLKCYLDTLEVTETVEHGKVYVGTCDNGMRVELAEHD